MKRLSRSTGLSWLTGVIDTLLSVKRDSNSRVSCIEFMFYLFDIRKLFVIRNICL